MVGSGSSTHRPVRSVAVTALGLVAGVGVAAAHPGENLSGWDGHMWSGGGHVGGWGGGWWLLHGLLWLAVVVAAVAAIYWAVSDRDGSGGDDAMAILRQQYARGEIDHDEFEERRRRLQE